MTGEKLTEMIPTIEEEITILFKEDIMKSHRWYPLSAMCSLILLITLYIGCAGNQHTLNLTDLPRPVYIGDRITPSVTIDSSRVQIIRSISFYSSHEKEGETISEGKHGTFSSGNYEHVKENIFVKIDHP